MEGMGGKGGGGGGGKDGGTSTGLVDTQVNRNKDKQVDR